MAGTIVAAAAFPVLTSIGPRDAKVRQRVHALDGPQVHATAEAAVTAVGTAEGNEFLATKAHAAAATVTRVNLELGFVDEFHGDAPKQKGAGCPTPLSNFSEP